MTQVFSPEGSPERVWMERVSDELDSFRDARARNDRLLLIEKIDAGISNGWQRGQRAPEVNLFRFDLGGGRIPSQFEDCLRSPRENQLRRGLNRLLLHIGEHVVASGDVDHVVDESNPAACKNPSQHERFAIEDDQSAWSPAPGDPIAYRGYPSFDRSRHALRFASVPNSLANLLERHGDVSKARVAVNVGRDLRAIELRTEIRLTRIDNDQIRMQRHVPLDVRIEQGPHALQLRDRRWIAIEAADGGHLIAGADGEEHFGDGRDEGDNAPWGLR